LTEGTPNRTQHLKNGIPKQLGLTRVIDRVGEALVKPMFSSTCRMGISPGPEVSGETEGSMRMGTKKNSMASCQAVRQIVEGSRFAD